MAYLATEKKQEKLSLGLIFIIVIMHFRVTRAKNFRTSIRCMNELYAVGKDQATVFGFGVSCLFCEYSYYFGDVHVKCNILYNVDSLILINYLCVLFVGDCLKSVPRSVV
jgi:hypothetical protein